MLPRARSGRRTGAGLVDPREPRGEGCDTSSLKVTDSDVADVVRESRAVGAEVLPCPVSPWSCRWHGRFTIEKSRAEVGRRFVMMSRPGCWSGCNRARVELAGKVVTVGALHVADCGMCSLHPRRFLFLLSEGVVQWCSGGASSLGGNKLGVPTVIESDVPFLAVHDGVMIGAQQAHVGDIAVPGVLP